MADCNDEHKRGSSDGRPSSYGGQPVSSGRDPVTYPDESVTPAVVGVPADLTSSERAAEADNDEANESNTNTPPITSQSDTNRVRTANSFTAKSPWTGGLQGPNDDIRRFDRMTRAAASTTPIYALADGWCAMFSIRKSFASFIFVEL